MAVATILLALIESSSFFLDYRLLKKQTLKVMIPEEKCTQLSQRCLERQQEQPAFLEIRL